MTNRTRYFVITSLLVLAIGLGTGLVAYYVGLPAAVAGNGPAELSYIPHGATVLAYAEVRDIMTSDVRQRIRSSLPFLPGDGQRRFQEQTGIDIETDIDHLVASLQLLPGGDTAALVVARGRFSDVKIEAFMRERGAEVEEYGGKRLIVRADPSASGESMALAFLEPGLVAIGKSQALRAAIDLQSNGNDVTKNAELMDLLGSIDLGNAWAIGRLDALRSGGTLPSNLATRLPPINWFAVTGRVDHEIRGIVRADARDDQAANDLRDVVRGFLALAKLQAGTRPELQATLDSLQLGGTGKSVALSFTIPGEVFDRPAPQQ